MSRYWSAVVRGLTPYVPGEQPHGARLIKLNTNENPYGPSPRVIEALRAEIGDGLRLYPDPSSERLRQAVAERHGVGKDHVFVGNGSDEVLAHVFQGLLKHEAPLLFPDVTYSFYPVYCRLFGIAFREVPLTAGFEIDVRDYRSPNGGIILPNPNAPTGRLLGLDRIEQLLADNPGSVVVIDEAYVDFGGNSCVALVPRFPNLLVTRTLSKSHALAGLRVGYAVGQPDLVQGLVRVKDSFNSYPVDRLAEAGAVAALKDVEYFEANRRRVIESRQRLSTDLEGIGFEVLPSSANFVFVRHPARSAADLARALRDAGIIVRHFRSPPRIEPYLRITVGTDEECRALVSALRGLVG